MIFNGFHMSTPWKRGCHGNKEGSMSYQFNFKTLPIHIQEKSQSLKRKYWEKTTEEGEKYPQASQG